MLSFDLRIWQRTTPGLSPTIVSASPPRCNSLPLVYIMRFQRKTQRRVAQANGTNGTIPGLPAPLPSPLPSRAPAALIDRPRTFHHFILGNHTERDLLTAVTRQFTRRV